MTKAVWGDGRGAGVCGVVGCAEGKVEPERRVPALPGMQSQSTEEVNSVLDVAVDAFRALPQTPFPELWHPAAVSPDC